MRLAERQPPTHTPGEPRAAAPAMAASFMPGNMACMTCSTLSGVRYRSRMNCVNVRPPQRDSNGWMITAKHRYGMSAAVTCSMTEGPSGGTR